MKTSLESPGLPRQLSGKGPPADAGDTGPTPGPGISRMLQRRPEPVLRKERRCRSGQSVRRQQGKPEQQQGPRAAKNG